jgi:hypothetical protein
MRRFLICSLGALAVACSSSSSKETADASSHPGVDATQPKADVVTPKHDTGKPQADAGHHPLDAAKDGAVADAGTDIGFLEPTASIPALDAAVLTTTLDAALLPEHAVVSLKPDASVEPSTPSVLSEWLSEGYGLTTLGAGEPLNAVLPPSTSTVPTPGSSPTMLLRFVHLPDIQLADDESPNRLCNFDDPASEGSMDAAFRPQEGYECRILNAAVRTINALNTPLPLSFVLTGGDNSDSAQTNEIDWFMSIMDGSKFVKCDSGDYNDPVPGPNNDGKDPFVADGLDVPWWWVTGNHDVLVQGNLVVNASTVASALGTTAMGATRDYTQPGAPLFTGPIVPDARRKPLTRTELMTLVAADGDGHGVGATQVASGKAFYTFDVPNTPLRFAIFDTAAETGYDEGIIHQADVTSTIKPMLDQALSDGKYVIAASHHSTDMIGDGSGVGGTKQADALTQAEWESFLGSYDNLLFSLVGHVHTHRVKMIAPTTPDGGAPGHAFWEVMTGALADYPHQFRLIEIWDDDNGWIRMRAIVTNYQTDGDQVAADGRQRGIADQVSGWAHDGYGTALDRNVEIYIQKP